MKTDLKNKHEDLKLLSPRIKGFTLIELIAVIVIVGMLALLSVPKFLNYIEEVKMAQIKSDIKVAEIIMDEYLSHESALPDDLEVPDTATPLSEGRLFDVKGKVISITGDEADYRDITGINEIAQIKSKLNGRFVANENGKVYYAHNNIIGGGQPSPELTIAEDQPYRDESVPTLASIWGEDAKEVMAMVTALESVGVSVPTQEDAWNLYQDIKVADPELLSKMVAVQPQIWTGDYSEVTDDLNSIKDGANTWLTDMFGTLQAGTNAMPDELSIGTYTLSPHTYISAGRLYIGINVNGDFYRANDFPSTWIYENIEIVSITNYSSYAWVYTPILVKDQYGVSQNYNTNGVKIYDTAFRSTVTTHQLISSTGLYISISADAPILDGEYDATANRRYPEAPWLGAYSNTWQDVKMAKSGNKDIYLGTIDRYINDIINVLTWDNVDDISYYGGGSATKATLTEASGGLLEVIITE